MQANLPPSAKPRVVIIGGGFAGINLVNHLPRNEYQVVMIDRNNHHTFQPLLYQVATSGLEPGSIAYPLRKLFRHRKDFHFRMAEVLQILPEKNQVQTTIGYIDYDYLAIATGSETNYFGMGDLEHNCMPLKSVAEAVDLRHLILQAFEKRLMCDDPMDCDRLVTFVLAGAGPTGVELSGALSELRRKVLPRDYPELDLSRMRIILLDPAPRVLASMSEQASANALKYLQEFDIDVRLGVGVKSYDGKQAVLSNGEILATEVLIWAAGVKGSMPAGLDNAIIAKGNRIIVDEYNRVQGFKNIFAIGDVAQQEDPRYPRGLPMLAPVAIQQGKHMGRNFRRLLEKRPLEAFKYFDKGSLATVGRSKAVGDLPRNWHIGGFFAWVTWIFVHIFFLVGFRNKVTVMTEWIWNYLTYDRRVRLIIRPFFRTSEQSKDNPAPTSGLSAPGTAPASSPLPASAPPEALRTDAQSAATSGNGQAKTSQPAPASEPKVPGSGPVEAKK